MLIFDIGANIGNWSIENYKFFLNTTNSPNTIISVEGSEDTFNILCDNIKDIKNIIPLNYVVSSSKDTYITFYECIFNTLSTTNIEWLTNEKSRFNKQAYSEKKIKVISIDRMIEQYGKPDLIKIDVEAGEYDCIKSLSTKVDTLCFEWASEMIDVTFNCLDYLYNLGFRKFYIQNNDDYLFRPNEYNLDINKTKELLSLMKPKIDWGMIWCQ